MTTPAPRRVFLVLRGNGTVYHVCTSRCIADDYADRIGGTVEDWPIDRRRA